MLISNTLFRMGGAAIYVTNKWTARFYAKYRLVTTVRVHKVHPLKTKKINFFTHSSKGADDTAYRAVFQEEDEDKMIVTPF
jgi:3-ketoacyl-CoA synthase